MLTVNLRFVLPDGAEEVRPTEMKDEDAKMVAEELRFRGYELSDIFQYFVAMGNHPKKVVDSIGSQFFGFRSANTG